MPISYSIHGLDSCIILESWFGYSDAPITGNLDTKKAILVRKNGKPIQQQEHCLVTNSGCVSSLDFPGSKEYLRFQTSSPQLPTFLPSWEVLKTAIPVIPKAHHLFISLKPGFNPECFIV